MKPDTTLFSQTILRVGGLAAAAVAAVLLMAWVASPALATTTGGAQRPSEQSSPPPEETPPGTTTDGGGVTREGEPEEPKAPVGRARLSRNGRTAIAPSDAPKAVKDAIRWANRITRKPYRYGGGHRRFRDRAYDCSGAVSYALRGARLVKRPLDSSSYMRWGKRGTGEWITVYTNPGHAYVVIAGLRFDTSGRGEKGPRWRSEARSSRGYRARHVPGL